MSDKIKLNDLLEKAHGLFLANQFDKALFLYSQALYVNPNNKEYQIYPLLCDIAYENNVKAFELFNIFLVEKALNSKDAIKNAKNEIDKYSNDENMILEIINDISMQTAEAIDAIEYQDFLKLEQTRGSFKTAYEDIMFSTKVAITSKDDLVDFINKLIENGFDTTAYNYLDGFNEVFSYDKDLTELYKKLESKNIDNNQ